MDERPQTIGQRAKRTIARLTVVAIILALGAGGAILLSELNARTYTLEAHGNELWVMKGRYLPLGASPFQPADPRLAQAYAPIPLDGAAPPDPQVRYRDRDELDRTLFDLLTQLARPKVASDDPQALERGLYYVGRAASLGGITEEQRRALGSLQADISFYAARTKLDHARQLIGEAVAQLKVAADAQNRHARAANQMLLILDPPSREMGEALRKAVHAISAPAEGGAASVP